MLISIGLINYEIIFYRFLNQSDHNFLPKALDLHYDFDRLYMLKFNIVIFILVQNKSIWFLAIILDTVSITLYLWKSATEM